MRKAELEEHYKQYLAKEATIGKMVGQHRFPEVFTVCVGSFPHLVPTMRYRKQMDLTPVAPEFLSFRVIVEYAPVLFEHAVLETLRDFIKATRQLAKHDNGYLEAFDALNDGQDGAFVED